MAISGTTSSRNSRRRMKNRHRARTASVNARTAIPTHRLENVQLCRAANADIDDRQMRVAAILSSCDFDLNIRSIPCVPARRNKLLGGCTQSLSGESFLGCTESQSTVRADFAVPTREVVQPALHRCSTHSQQREPLPLLKAFEKCFHPVANAGCPEKMTKHRQRA